MTGSLQTKGDKYYIVLNVYEKKKRKAKWIPTGLSVKGNKRKAEQLLHEAIQEYEQKKWISEDDTLFSDSIRNWLTIIQRKVDPVTSSK